MAVDVQLIAALLAVSLEDLPSIIPTLRSLDARHARYGVTAKHCDTVATALIRTFGQALGGAFTLEVRMPQAPSLSRRTIWET